MNAKELIDELSKVPPDCPVVVNQYDCGQKGLVAIATLKVSKHDKGGVAWDYEESQTRKGTELCILKT